MDPLEPWPENAEELRPRWPAQNMTWGYLIEGSPFGAIFPDGRVPLRSIIPMTPRERGAPPCYLVAIRELSEAQIAQLATLLWQQWRPECESLEQAVTYIQTEGLPLRCSWFSGVATRQLGLILP